MRRKLQPSPPTDASEASPRPAAKHFPAWVTPELIAETLDCWQPHFAKALTADDAVEILTNVGRLLDALGQGGPAAAPTTATAPH